MKLFCPCCERPASPRTDPISERDALRAYIAMRARGVTREAMLGEHRETMDQIAPGFTKFVADMPAAVQRALE